MCKLRKPLCPTCPVAMEITTVTIIGLLLSCPAVDGIDAAMAAVEAIPDSTEGVSVGLGINTTPGGDISLDLPMENNTAYSGDNVKILCEISGQPLPTYRWYRGTTPLDQLQQDDHRYSAKPTNWGSRLKIERARPEDSGQYRCVGSNLYGERSTTGFLTVRQEYNPNKGRDRDRDNDRDDDQGPHPDELDIIEYNPYDISSEENPDGTGASYGSYSPEDHNGDAFCQPYRGAACSKYLSGKNIYVRSSVQQGHMEEQLTIATTVMGAQMTMMSETCARYAFEGVCYFSISQCDATTTTPTSRQLCQDECLILTEEVCKDEYHRIKTNPLIGAGNDDLLPVCSSLPPRGTPAGDNCLSLGLQGHRCYNGTGTNYKGIISRTVSGRECDVWANHYSMEDIYNKYTELNGRHNHCRNPGNQEDRPWCYVRGMNNHREFCEIPKCGMGMSSGDGLMYIVGPVIAVVCVIIIIMTVICLCQRRKKKRNGDHKAVGTGAPPGHTTTQMQLEMNGMLKPPLQSSTREFPINNVRFVQELGEGTYGKVFKGELVGCYGDNSLTPVVIKVLKEPAVAKTQQDFHREVETFTDFKHPNLVTMLGAVLKQTPRCILYEHLSHCDLHEYLVMHSPHSDMAGGGPGGILSLTDMAHVATQIAAGMEYLGLHQYVHSDLATRNVLVTADNLTVKIADLGVARALYSADYYRLQNQSQVPVRWMAPEAVLYGKLGAESDVWAFGVTLWEIYSHGLQPYYGYANTEVVEMIRQRQILPCPEGCPARVYSLMVECWHEVPGRRPCFKELHQRLCQWQKEAHMAQASLALAASAHNSSAKSAHSSSTHSHPSHHSSTGGNQTATTGVSSGGPGPHVGGYHYYGPPPPHYGQPMAAHHRMYRGGPSPPASLSSHSHKSSSVHSSDSPSAHDHCLYKPGVASPNKGAPGKMQASTLIDNKDLYIPENRTSEI